MKAEDWLKPMNDLPANRIARHDLLSRRVRQEGARIHLELLLLLCTPSVISL
jgi:hypothetical protein